MNQGDLFEEVGWIDIPDGLLYWQPDFILAEEAKSLFSVLSGSLPWQQLPIKMYGKEVMQPRLQAWFGEAYTYSGLTLSPAKMPEPLKRLQQRCEVIADSSFNSVLANLYRDGLDYMGWHQDNEPELGLSPSIASVTLGETRRFVLRHLRSGEKREFELNSGSLLIMAGKTQIYWQHSVPKTTKARGPRINLTYRHINF
ncbi:alpha-ketoglutarate-dependent dioxygenase AlkB family protein [Enterovibrio nigricans]|uniref:Alkylated DNA repair dioxygenase AlkB n=1 Tax=Enterovibrio nigricans DSM 22720 TaxID=1121868 RepID=A0A1T4VEE0_9GAMM|nr:alpha-ketoglutarate-dependent dioxygenase AlkB [Enterovibrio nigricans]PKF49530.1 alpha-ketoglutarate-dependent dioxygenase AlkB [Enterovibrio nigricans]SKA62891.1 Alkylated DNA repair dioxygenase AlkB [Enterovibrio nigricans DSM 22720]